MRRIAWTILTVLVAGIALYTLAGFFLAPRLVKGWIETVVTADSGGRLEAERISFNPYTLELSFANLTLYDRENKIAFSVGQSDAVLDLRSLSERRPMFSGEVEVTDIRTSPAAPGEFFLAVRRITADGAALRSGGASVGRLRVDQPGLRLRRDGGGELNVPVMLRQLLLDPAASRLTFTAIEVNDGRVQFVDDAVSPAARFEADAVRGRIETPEADSIVATAQGRLTVPAGGDVSVDWQRNGGNGDAELSIAANGVALPAVSAYASDMVGRAVIGGRFDLDFGLRHADGRAAADFRLTTEGLEIAAPGPAADSRRLDLAVALLEDRSGKLGVGRSVEQAAGDGFEPGRRLSRMLNAALDYAARNPFEMLSSIAGEPASALRRLDFLAGSAELIAPSRQTLGALADVLERRPRLALVMHPAYDPVADRDALARQQVRQHVILAASARPPGQADDAAVDFGDEKVRGILDEFAATRLPAASRSTLAGDQPERGEAYYRAVFDALVVHQDVDQAALRRLARYRVQSAVGELARLGIDAGRLVRHESIDVRASGSQWIGVEIDAVPDERPAASPSSNAHPAGSALLRSSPGVFISL